MSSNLTASAKSIGFIRDPPPTSTLQAMIKSDLQKAAEAEALKKEAEVKQKNVEVFFDDLQKVKKSFW